MFAPLEQMLPCMQSILITVSLVMFQYGARKAYYWRTGFSAVSKSYWFSIRKLHCTPSLCYSPQLLQGLAAKTCSVLRVAEIKHLLLATKCYAKPERESLKLYVWPERHARGIPKTVSWVREREENPAMITVSNYLQDTDYRHQPILSINPQNWWMHSFKYLPSCSSVWNLDFSTTQFIFVFVYFFSQKSQVKRVTWPFSMYDARTALRKSSGAITRDLHSEGTTWQHTDHKLSPATCPKPLLHNANLTSEVQNRFAKLTYVFYTGVAS